MAGQLPAADAAPGASVDEVTRPLSGVRILAIEQMQALPFATQLLARLGADVVKIEPVQGESGRGALPAIGRHPRGRRVGATFLRNNLNKRTISVNLKSAAGRELVLNLASRFDVVAENSKPGVMQRLGLAYDDIKGVHPTCIYASVSGFGNMLESPYSSWPAFAPVVEAMSGIYEMKRVGDAPHGVPRWRPRRHRRRSLRRTMGILAALRHRDITGSGQQVDVAMFDSVIAMTDIVQFLVDGCSETATSGRASTMDSGLGMDGSSSRSEGRHSSSLW